MSRPLSIQYLFLSPSLRTRPRSPTANFRGHKLTCQIEKVYCNNQRDLRGISSRAVIKYSKQKKSETNSLGPSAPSARCTSTANKDLCLHVAGSPVCFCETYAVSSRDLCLHVGSPHVWVLVLVSEEPPVCGRNLFMCTNSSSSSRPRSTVYLCAWVNQTSTPSR